METTGKNQYSDTLITDFYLDLAKFPDMTKLVGGKTPVVITVDPKYQYRPDLLSYALYDNSSYWWLIVMLNRNSLKDPIRDLKAGMSLLVLSRADLDGIM